MVKIRGSPKRITVFNMKSETRKLVLQRKGWLPLLPTDPLKMAWDLVLVILLFTNALLTPFQAAYIDDSNNTFNIISQLFNAGFGVDIIMNFISAYYSSTDGLITDKKRIFMHYFKRWFWIDLALVVPIDTIVTLFAADSAASAQRIKLIMRLARFPRIYRILKVLRMFKNARVFVANKTLNRMIKQFSLNIGVIKMGQVLANLLFLNHIAACIWFLSARLNGFTSDTWVVRTNLMDADSWTQYVASYYWAFQTLTTVGYGDINPETSTERTLAVLWMIVGVCLYSFAIANLSSILQSMDKRTMVLRNKITAFNNFAAKVKLPIFLRTKVQRYFELNHKENIFYWIDPQGLIEELPQNLRHNLLLYTFYPMIKSIKLFHMDANFTASIVTHLKLLKLKKNEILYREEDPAQEVYFISKGSVKFVMEGGEGIFSLIEGTYFGEMEVLAEVKRLSFCQAMEATLLMVCSKKAFLQALQGSPSVDAFVKRSSLIRKEKFDMKINELVENDESRLRGDDSMAKPLPSTRKLLKSSDYFYSIVNHSKKKRFSRIGGNSNENSRIEDNLSKRGSELHAGTPKLNLRAKLGLMDSNKASNRPSIISDRSYHTPKGAFSLIKKNITSPAKPFRSGERRSVNMGNKDNDNHSLNDSVASAQLARRESHQNSLGNDHSRSSISSSQASNRWEDNLANSKSHPESVRTFGTSFSPSKESNFSPSRPFEKRLSNFSPLKRDSLNSGRDGTPKQGRRFSKIALQAMGAPDEDVQKKSEIIKSIDQSYVRISNLKEEIDSLYEHFEQKKEVADSGFELIEKRQKELDALVQKLLTLKGPENRKK